MPLLEELKKAHQLYAQCPSCGDEFSLATSGLFDATKPLPPKALEHIARQKADLTQTRADLKKRKLRADTKPELSAISSITGKVLEKIAPSLPGFPVEPGDCRALFEPIDYVVFKGLTAQGQVDALIFVDVKSGKARLGADQRQIKNVVESQKVRLHVIPQAKEVA